MTEETKTAAKETAAEAATEEVKAEAQETETEAKPDKASKLKSENKALTAENEKLKKELAETSDKYLRMLAEYDNFRRRTQKEKEGKRKTAQGTAPRSEIHYVAAGEAATQ